MTRPTLAAAGGALGQSNAACVEALAKALPRPAETVLDEPGCRVLLDRPLEAWTGETEGCGVFGRSGDRRIRCGPSGAAPLYYRDDGDGLHYATTVDALARSAPARLTVDWLAWASILTLGYPLGDRTPFREVRRLLPGVALRWVSGQLLVEREPWAWAEVEPSLSVADGAPAVLDAMRAAVRAIPPGQIACQLSGGLDSRLCLGLLAERRPADVRTITADQDFGHDAEARAAGALASAFDVPHQVAPSRPEDFWPGFELLALRVDYQHIRPPWRVAMLPELRAIGGTVVDGFGFDTFATPGDRFFSPATLDPAGGNGVVDALWTRMSARAQRPGALGLDGRLSQAMWESARLQLLESSLPFAGHPLRAVLTFYLARQVRAIALESQAVLGTDVPVALPLATDAVARAAFAISPQDKHGGKLYDALLAELDPRLETVVSTRRSAAAEPGGGAVRRASQSRPVARELRRCLEEGPLRADLLPGKLRALERAAAGTGGSVPRGLFGAALMHLWHRRYAGVLRPVDPADALELTSS